MNNKGRIISVSGPVVKADNMTGYALREICLIGNKKLIAEIIILEGDVATLQVYEDTEGIQIGEFLEGTGRPLSLKLGPGVISSIFDGIQRPLNKINEISYGFIPEGIGLISIDEEKIWDVKIDVVEGQKVKSGDIYARVKESSLIENRVMVPNEVEGTIIEVKPSGQYNINEVVAKVQSDDNETITDLKLYQVWPVSVPRPSKNRIPISYPLITGQRIVDTFFPIAKGGTVAIPGGFGTGKTITQQQLAKYSDADIIVYIGCGERGNEMTEVLEEFPHLIDPKSGEKLINRTVLIANTSNMPVAAREASIYTGVTIAEYYRDMGYHVAIMADSTSRWAEALREISGRLEELPAEEGYPAYLASRLAEFYERAGYVENFNGTEGSVTIIGAVSPAGGDFSEPVTQNTKRFVTTFLGLDKRLAYQRHFPSINWLTSYSGYVKILNEWFNENVAQDFHPLRAKMLGLLTEEDKLQEIVKLVGVDVLPDDQRMIIEVAKLLKISFLQQNAFNAEDACVPLEKQYRMLKTIDLVYENGLRNIKLGTSISQIVNEEIFDRICKIKYTVPNKDLSLLDELDEDIIKFYSDLYKKYK